MKKVYFYFRHTYAQNLSGLIVSLIDEFNNLTLDSILFENNSKKYAPFPTIELSNEEILRLINLLKKGLRSRKVAKNDKSSHREHPNFSQAVMDIAKANLKKFQDESDEAFLVRADINRKLSSL